MTDQKKPEILPDDALEDVEGGAGYLKLGDIKGESVIGFGTVTGINVADTIYAGSVGGKGDVLIQNIGFPDDGGGPYKK